MKKPEEQKHFIRVTDKHGVSRMEDYPNVLAAHKTVLKYKAEGMDAVHVPLA